MGTTVILPPPPLLSQHGRETVVPEGGRTNKVSDGMGESSKKKLFDLSRGFSSSPFFCILIL